MLRFMGEKKNQRRPRKSRDWGTCPETGKIRYGERFDAQKALQHAFHERAAARLDGVEPTNRVVRAYKCRACRGFHTTSMATYGVAARAPRRAAA